MPIKTIRTQTPRASHSGTHSPQSLLEHLESRTLLSTVSWIAAGSGSWSTAANWSGGVVPGASDDVVINVPAVTVTYSTGTTSVHSINATGALAVTGGSLSLTAGTSVLSGALTLSGGTLTLTGSATAFTANGATNIAGGNITVAAGATAAFPTVTSYQTPTASITVNTIQATGVGSTLDLSHVTSFTGPSNFDCGTNVDALAGGKVKLTALTSISAQANLKSDGAGSVLDLSHVTSFTAGNNAFTSGLQATSSAQVLDPLLTTLSTLTLTLDGTGTMSTSQMTSLVSGQINVSGGTPSFASLSNFSASGATVSGGATLSLPALVSYQIPTTANTNVTLEATGIGSVLDLSHLTSFTGPSTFNAATNVSALAGGKIKLTALPSINAQSVLKSDGAGSVLDLSHLASFTGGNNAFTSGLQATSSAQVLDPLLTTISTVALTLDGTSTISTSQITSLVSGQINVSGGTPNFAGLTNFTASGATVSGGATLALPALTSYEIPTTANTNVTLEATGIGSVLDLSHLTSFTGPSTFNAATNVSALAGGKVKLTALPTINAQSVLKSDGAGSVLDLSHLTSFTGGNNAFTSGLQATSSAQILDPLLTTLSMVAITLDGTSTISINQVTTSVSGQINVTGGNITFAGLSNFTASAPTASGGATLVLPALISYQIPTTANTNVSLEATGVGSILDLSHLTSFTGPSTFNAATNISALAGGKVKLTALPTINAQSMIKSDGTGSVLDLSHLTSFTGGNNAFTSGLQATDSAQILDPLLTTLSIVALTLDGTGAISINQITTSTGGQINVTGGNITFTGLSNFNGSGGTISGGATLALPDLTSYQTPTASITVALLEATGPGSTLDLSHLVTITGPNQFDCGTQIEALAGGHVNLSHLTTVNAQLFLEADGTGSTINLSSLATFNTTDNAFTSGIQISNGGERIGTASTTTHLSSSSSTSAPGQSVTFTATVSASAGSPTGAIQFLIDGVDFGSPVTLVSDSATSAATTSLALGNHTITANYSGDSSFGASTAAITQTISSKTIPTITWANPAAIIYGTALSSTQLNATTTVAGTFAYSPAAGTLLAAGASQTLSVTFTPTDTVTYATVTAHALITVNKASLTVTADDNAKTAGDPNPALTATISGFVNGDNSSVISGAPALSTTATASSPAGNYPITVTVGSLSAANYNFTTFVPATLTVAAVGALPDNFAPIGFLDNLTPAIIQGWAIDKDTLSTPATVQINIDGAEVGATTANLSRPDLLAAYGSADHGFSYTMPALSVGLHKIDIYALDTGTSTPTLIASKELNTNQLPTGWIDVLNASSLEGWAYDPNTPTTSIQIRYQIDADAPVLATANVTRPDLTPVLGSSNHGFNISLPTLTAGSHTLTVWLVDTTTDSLTSMGARRFTVANPAGNPLPNGHVDILNSTTVAGWAYDPSNGPAAVNIRIDIDGTTGTPFVANLARPDLVPVIGSKFHGFSQSLTLTPGAHRISVYALDSTTSTPVLLSSQIVNNSAPTGWVDSLTQSSAQGWAYSPATPTASPTVRLDIDGIAGAATTANLSRPDLTSLFGIANLGFTIPLPKLLPGTHTIQLYLLDPLTLTPELLLSTTLVTA